MSGLRVDRAPVGSHQGYAGRDYRLRSVGCETAFAADPKGRMSAAHDPVCGIVVTVTADALHAGHSGVSYVF